jgi:hypothetical protein
MSGRALPDCGIIPILGAINQIETIDPAKLA